MTAMVSLLYTSRASDDLQEEDLSAILADAQRNNALGDITGVLLSYAGRFVQVLEGPRDAVTDCFARIGGDARHHDVVTLSQQEIGHRRFGAWSMRDVRVHHGADRAVKAFLDALVQQPDAAKVGHTLELLQRLVTSETRHGTTVPATL
jgi:hypothetical protein